MKKIKNIMLLSLVAVVLSTTSCSDFLNVNTDPNRVTDINVTPNLIFPMAENEVGVRQGTEFVFLIDNSFTETNWDLAYNTLYDLNQTRTKAIAAGDSVLAGASIVLSVKLWQETVDQFGALPYKQAFDYAKHPTPAYDKAADIYTDLLAQLDQAILYLHAVTPKSTFTTTDIIFARGGDVTTAIGKWNKFANTIRLRILLRQSAVLGAAPTAEIAKITANGGLLGAGEDVSVNPGYSNTADKQNPFYGAFGLTPAAAPATTDNTANNYFLKVIEVSQENDARLDQFYQAPIAATDFGALNGNIIPGGAQIVGTGFGPGLLGDATTGPTRDQFIMPAFESLFFQAEAVARGWLPGDAQAVYTNAVQEDFRWLNVTTTSNTLSGVAITDSISNYYLTNNSTPWPGSDKVAQINLIAFQKYIALCGIDPLESWSDLRRGVLILPAGYLSNNKNRAASLPNVLTYPQTEFTTNHGNIPSPIRTTTSIFTEKLFWQP
jgi:hypothetical protein